MNITKTKTIKIDGRVYELYGDDLRAGSSLPDLSKVSVGDLYNSGIISDYASNDVVTIWQCDIGAGQYLYICAEGGEIKFTTINSFILSDFVYDYGQDYCKDLDDLPAWLASMGLDPFDTVLRPANPDYDGPCRIWCQPNYSASAINAPREDFVRDGDKPEANMVGFAIREFTSYAKAQAYVDDYYNAPSEYDELDHGQIGSDFLTIVEA